MEESASETKNSITIDIMGLYLPRVIDFPGVGIMWFLRVLLVIWFLI